MADGIGITQGSGATASTEEITTLNGGAVSAQHVQRIVPATRTADGIAIDEAAGSGVVSTSTKRVTLATDVALPTGSNTIGNVGITTINSVAPAFGTGVRGATVQRVTIATDDVVPVTGTFFQGTQPVSIATNTPVGNVAHDGVDSGAPIKVGGRAINAEITAVANNDRSDFVTDLAGKQIVLPYANPENFVSGAITTAMTGTTSTSLMAAPAAGLRNYITAIIVSNAHATVGTDVIIQDGSGGTTLMTIPAASVYGGAVITLPTPLRQPTANTALFCANVTTGASTKVSVVGYKGA